MEAFGSLCLISVFLVVAWLLYAGKSRSIKENLESVARKYGGQVFEGSLFENYSMRIQVDGVEGVLTYKNPGKNSPAFTRLAFTVSGGGILRIMPEGIVASIRKMFGAQDIRVGDDVFDTRYVIQGDPEDWVRRYFDEPTRDVVKRLYAMGDSFMGGATVRIDKTESTLTVRVDYNFFSEQSRLDEFVRLCIQLLRRVRDMDGSGVVVVRSGQSGDAHCLVCGAALEGSIVRCRRCQTPHHDDCWNYYGGCAIYGCGEDQRA